MDALRSLIHATVIKIPSEGYIVLDVSSSTTIAEVKQLIFDKEGIPVNQQRLIFDGKELNNNNMRLHDCNIQKDSILDLILHQHVYEQKVVSKDTLAHAATCSSSASYYYSCTCGALGTEVFYDGDADSTRYVVSDEWSYNDSIHFHACLNGCGTVFNQANHTFTWVVDEPATENEAGLQHEECSVCGYAKEGIVVPAIDNANDDSVSDNKTLAQTSDSNNAAPWLLLSLAASLVVAGVAARKICL